MTPIRINGHRIPCWACGRHDAKVDYGRVYLCTSCLKAFVLGTRVQAVIHDAVTGSMTWEEAEIHLADIKEARR